MEHRAYFRLGNATASARRFALVVSDQRGFRMPRGDVGRRDDQFIQRSWNASGMTFRVSSRK